MTKSKFFSNIVGKGFNIWDVGILSILGYYAYGVFQGYSGSWWRLFDLFAGGLFFFFIIRQFNNFLKKKSKK